MDLDPVTASRLVVAWKYAVNFKQVARLLGPGVTVGWVLCAARRLRRAGVEIGPRPDGGGVPGHTYLFRTGDGSHVDLAGQDAYPVGVGTLIEGPWECGRCAGRMVRGFCVLGAHGHRFVCAGCVRVME